MRHKTALASIIAAAGIAMAATALPDHSRPYRGLPRGPKPQDPTEAQRKIAAAEEKRRRKANKRLGNKGDAAA